MFFLGRSNNSFLSDTSFFYDVSSMRRRWDSDSEGYSCQEGQKSMYIA
jgi:hypothetical protein